MFTKIGLINSLFDAKGNKVGVFKPNAKNPLECFETNSLLQSIRQFRLNACNFILSRPLNEPRGMHKHSTLHHE
jgi:hypothetical protein